MEASAPYSLHFQKALTSRQVEPAPFLRLQSADLARRLTEESRCLSVLPLYTVLEALQAGRLVLLSVPEWALCQFVQLVLHRGKVLTPQIEGMLEELRTALSDIFFPPEGGLSAGIF